MQIAGLRALQCLDLNPTLVGDASILVLSALSLSKGLGITDMRVSTAGVAELLKTRPGLRVGTD